LLLGLGLSGCSVINSVLPADKPARDDAGEVLAEGTESAFDLKVGDCVSEGTDATVVSSLTVLPCSEEHSDEVFFAFDLEEGDYPGEAAVEAIADERCVAEFPGYVGIDYTESALTYWPMTPTEAGWSAVQDREILCMVYDEAGTLSESVKGTGR
ncbi:septum formation family protein, partial [Leucobacter sp. M11]|uniref:septum formation family protein n=1 Tax=Leucobacter sp. M11 TaxID=2993565 RepID=UPI002D7F314F